MDHELLHRRAREQDANPLVYWLVRAVFQPFFHLYFRLRRIGREHIPADGPVIIAANPRSFLDPFVIGTMGRRPMYYVAKKEIFTHSFVAWILSVSALGAFPVDRGASDTDMVEREEDPRARRRRPDFPRGDAHPTRLARPPEARGRPACARDRRSRGAGGGNRLRRRPSGLADPAFEGAHSRGKGLVATVLCTSSGDLRAGELLCRGVPSSEIGVMLGHLAEAVDCVPLLASVARAARLRTPAIGGLADLVEGRIAPQQCTATVTAPARPNPARSVRAA